MRGIRLGFWNRLAIVATALTIMIVPTYAYLDYIADAQTRNEAWFDMCLEFPPKNEAAKFEECRQQYLEASTNPTGGFWWEVAGATLIICGVLYALIWLAVWIAKWVWRGRNRGEA